MSNIKKIRLFGQGVFLVDFLVVPILKVVSNDSFTLTYTQTLIFSGRMSVLRVLGLKKGSKFDLFIYGY